MTWASAFSLSHRSHSCHSEGDLTLGGNLSNSGTINVDSGGTGCGVDDILIRSSVAATQRLWSGSGTFTLQDVDVQDQAGTAAITAYSSTNTGNNGTNWTFNASCSGFTPRPPASVGSPWIF